MRIHRIACIAIAFLMVSIPAVILSDDTSGSDSVRASRGNIHQTVLDDWEDFTGDGYSMGDVRWDQTNGIELDQSPRELIDEFLDDGQIGSMGSWQLDDEAGVIKQDPIRYFGTERAEYISDSINTSDGGMALLGYTQFINGSGYLVTHPYVMKLDEEGTIDWDLTMNLGGDCYTTSIVETDNGDLIYTGRRTEFPYGAVDVAVARIGSDGTEKWNVTIDVNGTENSMEIVAAGTDSYMIIGDYYMNPLSGYFMLEVDGATGDHLFNMSTPFSNVLTIEYADLDDDGNYRMIGHYRNYTHSDQGLLMKVDHSGDIIWKREYGNRSYYNDGLHSLIEDATGSLYLIGYTNSYSSFNSPDLWLIKTDFMGIEQWNWSYDLEMREEGKQVLLDGEDGFIIYGNSDGGYSNNLFLVNFDPAGLIKWKWGYDSDSRAYPASVVKTPQGYTVTGSSMDVGAGEFFVASLNSTGGAIMEPMESEDLLEGIVISSVYQFEVVSYISMGSELYVSFSENGIDWTDSSGSPDGWDRLMGSPAKVTFGDVWSGDSFHYKLKLVMANNDQSQVGSVKLKYRQYASSGVYLSPRLEMNAPTSWSSINWTALIPSGTNISFQVRSAEDVAHLEQKSFTGPNGSIYSHYGNGEPINVAHSSRKVFQFKLHMNTSDLTVSPSISEVWINHNMVPELLDGSVDDPLPDVTDTVVFSVNYTDRDGDLPEFIYVNINGMNNTMNGSGSDLDVSDGRIYIFEADLPMGNQTYRFIASDGMDIVMTDPEALKVMIGPAASIEINSPSFNMTTDDTVKFNATCMDEDGNVISEQPAWSVSGGGSIFSDGTFEPSTTGEFNLSAEMDGIIKKVKIFISPGIPVGLVLEPYQPSITTDDVVQFMTKAVDADWNEFYINTEWSVTGGGTIDSSGFFNATIPGTYRVYSNYSGLSTRTTITITTGLPASIVVTGDRTEVKVDEKIQFHAVVKDSDGNVIDIGILWSVTGGGLIDLTGTFTADTAGDHTVTASYNEVEGSLDYRVISGSTDDDDDDTSGDDDDDGNGDKEGINPILFVFPVVLILIIVIIVILLLMRKGNMEEVEKEEEEKDLYSDLPIVDDGGDEQVISEPLNDDWMEGMKEE